MKRIIVVLAVFLPAALSSCGDEGNDGGPARVVATTGILATVTERVAGEDIEVARLVPEGASPHDFSLSAGDRLELEQAKLVIANGAGLEAGIPLEQAGAPVWELTEHAGELRDSDPHVWMDPTRVAASLPSLADALAEADPRRAESYRRRAVAYARELRDLDSELREQLAAIPEANRKLVTSHDALGYFAARYDLEVVATPFGPLGAEAEPSASSLEAAIEAVRQSGVPAVFTQAEDDPAVMERIASSAGVELVEGLLVESPGPAGSYEAMLRRDAELIAGALGAGEGAPGHSAP